MSFVRKFAGAMVVSALSGAITDAGAAGFLLQEQGSAGLGMAYAGGAAAVWDASTVWWNPAGMTAIPGRQVVAAGNLLILSNKFENSGSTLPPGQPLGSPTGDGGNAGGTFFLPSLFLTWQLAPTGRSASASTRRSDSLPNGTTVSSAASARSSRRSRPTTSTRRSPGK